LHRSANGYGGIEEKRKMRQQKIDSRLVSHSFIGTHVGAGEQLIDPGGTTSVFQLRFAKTPDDLWGPQPAQGDHILTSPLPPLASITKLKFRGITTEVELEPAPPPHINVSLCHCCVSKKKNTSSKKAQFDTAMHRAADDSVGETPKSISS
jgi:hypothetical protein